MSEDTQNYVKVETHDKRVWFGVSPSNIWRILGLLGFLWIGGGRDIVSGKKETEFATKQDLQRIETELKTVDRKVSYLSGRAGMFSDVGEGGSK